MGSEASIVARILKYLNTVGYAHKIHGDMHTVGRVDIVGCVAGRAIAIEVKQPGKQPTPRQQRELDLWRSAGAISGVACSVEDVEKLLASEIGGGMQNGEQKRA